MTEEISARHIAKLDGKNYQAWKFQMTAILKAYGIFDLVTGTRGKPAETDEAGVKAWQKENAKAMFLISTSVDDNQIQNLLVCDTAHGMWKKLSFIHEQRSEASKLTLTQRFHEYRMSACDSVVSHIAKVENLALQLRDVGETVSDVAIMAKIIASLPSKYNAFKTAWDSVPADQQSVEVLTERLVKEESQLATDDEVDAFAAMAISKQKKKVNKAVDFNHSKERKTRSSVECFYCKKPGHIARECRKKKRDSEKQKNVDGKSDCAFIGSSEKMCPVKTSQATVAKWLEYDQTDVWLMDSGASRHMTFRREWFSEFWSVAGEYVSLGDNKQCEVTGKGTVTVNKEVNGKWSEARLENVLYVPAIKKNLFSVGACTSKRITVSFKEDKVMLVRDNVPVAEGVKQENNIYRLLFVTKSTRTRNETNVAVNDLKQWHERLGHVNTRTIQQMSAKGIVEGLHVLKQVEFFCEPCQLGKAHRLKFNPKNTARSTKPGEFIHSDVCGPMSVESISGAKFFVTFKDDATGYRTVYFIRHKSDVIDQFREFSALVLNKFGEKIKTLRVDNGTEYINCAMKQLLRNCGIQLETSAPYTPEQNGRSERDNRTIVESARTMLTAKSLPKFLWAEAVNTAVYILNRIPTKRNLQQTPYELWNGRKPFVGHLRIFGSDAFAHVPKQCRSKFDDKARKVILVGYQGESTNYRLFDPVNRKVFVSRDVTFNEVRSSTTPATQEVDDIYLKIRDDEQEFVDRDKQAHDRPVQVQEEKESPQNDTRVAQQEMEEEPSQVQSICLRNRSTIRKPVRYEADFIQYHAPNSFKEAVSGPDSKHWRKAIAEELEAHEENKTWKIVPRTSSQQVIDSKWVFKIKSDTNGKITKFKARLCARGFKQEYGINYNETFSPVIRHDSLRVFLAIVTNEDLEMKQFDVRTAFLYGNIEEEIYMEIPEGLVIDTTDPVVCKLEKSLYGLKQAPRCWNYKFLEFLSQFNFKPNDADPCLFRGTVSDEVVILALFVDDGLVASKSIKVINKVLTLLEESFRITIGDAHCFVGVQIERNRAEKKMFIHQSSYTKRIIEKFGMGDANGLSVPADPHVQLLPIEKESQTEKIPYREAVGSLIFLSAISRPDISYAVNSVSRFLNCHNDAHWQAVKRIFRYLIKTEGCGIEYSSSGSHIQLVGFSDADYAGDLVSRRSTTGFVFLLAGGPVTWTSQRQKIVALSTTESEYVAAASAAKEAIWLRKLLDGLGIKSDEPITLKIDNQSAIRLSKNPEYQKRTKHIDVRYHFLREKVLNKEINTEYICAKEQLADLFTKALTKERLVYLCTRLNIVKGKMQSLEQREC